MSKKKISKFDEVLAVDNDLKFVVRFSNKFYSLLDTFDVFLDDDLETASIAMDFLKKLRKNYTIFVGFFVTEIFKKYK